MPKMKTHRGAAKRFKITGTGKVLRGKTSQNHRRHKSDEARAKFGKMLPMAKGDARRVRHALGI